MSTTRTMSNYKSQAVRLIAVIDIVLACIGILSEILSLTLLGQDNNLHYLGSGTTTTLIIDNGSSGNQSVENETDTSFNRSRGQPRMEKEDIIIMDINSAAATPRFLARILLTGLIFGFFLMQLFMATKLFVASKKMRSQPLSALQKFSCWRIWSFVFIFLLTSMFSIAVYFGNHLRNHQQNDTKKWTDYLLYLYLLIQIIFRVTTIYFISLYRKGIKMNLVHPAFSIPTHLRNRPPPPPYLQ